MEGSAPTSSASLPADAYGRDEEGNLGVKVLGKGNKEALQPLSPDEGPAIERWLETRRVLDPSCGRLFPRVRKNGGLRDDALDERAVHYLCATVADAVGIPTFMPHDMRRTFATRLYEAGCSDRTVQLLMRHANAATSRKYDRRGAAQLRTTRLEVTMWPAPSDERASRRTLRTRGQTASDGVAWPLVFCAGCFSSLFFERKRPRKRAATKREKR